jgi:hypothetical protein
MSYDPSIRRNRDDLGGWAIVVAYAVTIAYMLSRHAMWRDEAQLWLIGASQSSLSDVWATMSQEIRPLTWVTITWLIGRVTSHFEILKVVTLVTAVATAWVIVFLLPLTRLIQVMMLTGMLFLVGYSVISVDYMLATLLLMLTTAAIVRRWRPEMVVVLIGLLGSVHLLFTIIAVGLLAGVVVDWYLPSRRAGSRRIAERPLGETERDRLIRVGALAAATTAILLAIVSSWPDADNVWRPDRSLAPGDMIAAIGRGVVLSLVPSFDDIAPTGVAFVVLGIGGAALLLVLVVAAWRRGPGLGVAASVMVTLLLANRALGYAFPRWWHSGAITLAVILLIVLLGPWVRDRRSRPPAWLFAVALAVLSLQIAGSVTEPGRMVWEGPYSNAEPTARFIESICPTRCDVIADLDFRSSAVSAYLDAQPIYYVNGGYWGTFTVWSERTWYQPSWSEMISAAEELGNPVIVTSGLRGDHPGVERLAEFIDDLWNGEDFTVYRLAGPSG